ncbi:MAG: primosomal protein N' [Alphaproteobacteria bacterium 16-39-46]|nr:MAG: primosomal protein N' [Alphaproteobacteria bacterium 16-39-46]OZA43121.1 MAG: primosomal protein N' [Alphaproteobacteria bacterium 17-39-52]
MEEFLVSKDLFIEVLLPLPLDRVYTYKVPASLSLQKGSFINVSFGGRSAIGIVWELLEKRPDFETIKDVRDVLPLAPLSEALCDLIDWVARYTLSPKGSVLKLAMGEASLFKSRKRLLKKKPLPDVEDRVKETLKETSLLFTKSQSDIIEKLRQELQTERFSVTLLDGVTGSGKTEVYFEAMDYILKQKGQVLVLLPEISLSAQWMDRFKGRFGFEPLVWHSDLGASARKACWEKVTEKEALVVVGARSALFLPFSNLKFIVVDEEHDMSFKQDEGVLYNARDMAIVRAKIENIAILLASATPSLESRLNAKSGRFHLMQMGERAQLALLPEIQAIDMRLYSKEMTGISKKEGKMAFLSPPLRQALAQVLEAKEQSLLFLNRRGYAPLTLCRGCGYRFACPNCSAWLVLHHEKKRLLCHHCGYGLKCPDVCPSCQAEETLAACGPGVERIFEEVTGFLPDARVALLSSDTLTSVQKVQEMVDRIMGGEIDILIGTQVVSKGHHFPNLTLVGVVDADLGLTGGDLRASEKTYQVLQQVSGRSGRAQKKGRVFLQTFCPEHGVMKALISGDRDRFLEEEEEARRLAEMPPFGKLAALIITSHKSQEAEAVARALGQKAPFREDMTILGPAPAPLFQLGKRFRWRFLIKATKKAPLHQVIEDWLRLIKVPQTTKVHIDIDPYRFL